MKRKLILLLTLALLTSATSCKPRDPELILQSSSLKSEAESSAAEPLESEEKPLQDSAEPEASEAPQVKDMPLSAEDEVTSMLLAVRGGDKQEIQGYVDYNSLLKLDEGTVTVDWHYQEILSRMTFFVISARELGDTATVSTSITNVNMEVMLPVYFTEASTLEYQNAISETPLSEAEMNGKYVSLFQELLKKYESDDVEELVEIKLEKKGDNWAVKPDEKLRNAMLGNYFKARGSVGETA